MRLETVNQCKWISFVRLDNVSGAIGRKTEIDLPLITLFDWTWNIVHRSFSYIHSHASPNMEIDSRRRAAKAPECFLEGPCGPMYRAGLAGNTKLISAHYMSIR
jgi:hypothetical protein